MKHGQYVKRSTYQKVVEQNKKLMQDIRLLVTDDDNKIMDAVHLQMKYQDQFKEEKDWNDFIKDSLQRMLKGNNS